MVTRSCISSVVIEAEGSFANPLVIDCCECMKSMSYILGTVKIYVVIKVYV